MKTKRLYVDLETTGADKYLHGIHQAAFLVEIDGKVEETFDIKLQPFEGAEFDERAMEIAGVSEAKIKTYQSFEEGFQEIEETLIECSEEFHEGMPFTIVGYSVGFDVEFLAEFFSQNNARMGSIVNFNFVDVLQIARLLVYLGDKLLCKQGNLRLESMCHLFKIKINAHDALSDITATRELEAVLLSRLHKLMKEK